MRQLQSVYKKAFAQASLSLNPLYTGKPLNRYFNSEDSDEMPHNAAFHEGLHCLLR